MPPVWQSTTRRFALVEEQLRVSTQLEALERTGVAQRTRDGRQAHALVLRDRRTRSSRRLRMPALFLWLVQRATARSTEEEPVAVTAVHLGVAVETVAIDRARPTDRGTPANRSGMPGTSRVTLRALHELSMRAAMRQVATEAAFALVGVVRDRRMARDTLGGTSGRSPGESCAGFGCDGGRGIPRTSRRSTDGDWHGGTRERRPRGT